jgi:hypothetical protein
VKRFKHDKKASVLLLMMENEIWLICGKEEKMRRVELRLMDSCQRWRRTEWANDNLCEVGTRDVENA